MVRTELELSGFKFTGTTMTVSKEGFGVQIDTSNGPNGVILATAGSSNVGVISRSQLFGNSDAINLGGRQGQIADFVAGSAGFSAGDKLKTDSTGAWVTAGGSDAYFAIATQTATSGNLGEGVIVSGTLGGTGYAPPAKGQATTGTTGTAGQVTVASLTTSGQVVVTCAEDPGTNLVISDVVASSGYFTVYTKDVTGTPTRAALSGKKVNYIVIAL